jgi:pyruvate,water dikinase
MLYRLKGIFRKKEKEGVESVEALRTDFKARYHQFKLLLTANDKALEVMAEMERALRGLSPFGMHFVRSRCTTISINVFQMVKHLNELSAKKYEKLFHAFKEIQEKINPFLSTVTYSREGPLVVPLSEITKDMADQVGGKMANLGEMRNRLDLRVPGGFVITARAYHRFMARNDLQAEIDRRIQAASLDRLDQLYALSADIQQLIIRAPVPDDLNTDIVEQCKALEQEEGKGIRVALRSSALGEDLLRTSFAGQYRSELNVSREHILDAYKEILASKYGLSAMTYRLNRGIRDEDVAMCVGVIAMVDARSGGVTYSRNPVNLRDDHVVINSVWGLPKPVVDGSTPVDLFMVSRTDPLSITAKEIRHKQQKYVCYEDEGVCRLDVTGQEASDPSLTDEQVIDIARLAIQLEMHHGLAQDMEWVVRADGTILLLQCRPLQQIQTAQASLDFQTDPAVEPHVIVRGGTTVSPGAASGPVFIVKKDMDALRFPKEAVLVTSQALPRWASILNRASALVTEEGSIAGHLANVAREFSVPAIFGLQDGMKKLKEGQVVTVDADAASVYEGRVETVLENRTIRSRNLMEGSPVFEALSGAARNIVPLNLLDPGSPTFRPHNCKTFHDITRFCHEKAVHEMFQFGKDHRFPERSSKQLRAAVPMQWWVLNLDDGFRDEVDTQYIHIDNIVSIPMLALWQGITAFPWEGPPPIDGKGFMSVMFQATANTALVPGLRSQYADRNYFMISKNYCSLTSRLGFHFSTVEALISERAGENYVSFLFKGGAADLERKEKRVLFIAQLLEDYDFRVETKQDHLLARIEDREKDFMIKRLQILGYLTMHTRQLDMVMANEDSVHHYRAKMHKEIQQLLQGMENPLE